MTSGINEANRHERLAQPQPTAQPQGVDLPTAPGVWTRHGEWWSVRSFELRLYGARLRFENVPCTHEIGPTIYVNDLPRGGWLRAQHQPASEGERNDDDLDAARKGKGK